MLNDEDMDDTHLCLRCNKTIIGLQNYVNHRQRECNVDNSTKPSPRKEIEQHFVTGTFDFNSSTSGKKLNDYNFNFENDDREVELDDDSFQHPSDDQHNKSVETEFKAYDYDFFSSLELQSSSKRETPHSHHNTKILTHRILTRKATAALMAQNGDEWIDDPSVDAMSEDDDTDESETDDVPTNIYNQPPQSFTGGKWKPGNAPPDKPSNWDLQENESSNDGQLDKSIEREECNSPPPPTHTRGKWIPGTKIIKLEFKEDLISQKMAAERGNFWCGACSRNLASRKIYEHHLKSNLHSKRIKKQNEMEEAAEVLPQTNLNELSAHFKSLQQCEDEQQQQQSNDVSDGEIESDILNATNRASTSTPNAITRDEPQPNNNNNNNNNNNTNDAGAEVMVMATVEVEASSSATSKAKEEKIQMKKFRSRTIVTCFTCDMRLPVHLLGKHLISHFHYRKALQNPQKTFDIVLHNIHKIILQSPYQCHPCRYYFNTEHQFLRHWNSAQHLQTVTHINGIFLCSFCKFECNDNGDMAQHLTDTEHQQVVSLINRSKPIIIRKVTPCVCMNCDTHFRYNIQLMHHLKVCNHTVTDNKQHFSCTNCHKVFQSGLRLQKHQAKVHHLSVFFCSECQMQFQTATEARIHRRTALHKTLSSRKKLLSLAANDQLTIKLKKVCPICKDERLDVLDLKNHIHESHPEHHYSCGMCGEKFVFPQEVSRHVRDKVCKFYNSTKTIQSPTTTILASVTTTTTTASVATPSTASTSNVSSSDDVFSTLITTDSIKFASLVNCSRNDDKVENSHSVTTGTANSSSSGTSSINFLGQGMDMNLIDNNFCPIMSVGTIMAPSTVASATSLMYNSHDDLVLEERPFDMINDAMEEEETATEIQFTCKMCLFSTNSHAEFLFHEILHQNLQHKSGDKIECPYCKKMFRKQSLRDHLRQHTNERIFVCPFDTCPMSFTRKANLKNHINNMHNNDITGNDDSRPIKNVCQLCGKNFASKYILEQHKHVHRHQIETKRFPCQIQNCLYVARNTSDEKSHLLTHSDERLFYCEHHGCEYQGKTMEQLRSHSRKHQQIELKYACEHCDYKTKLTSHLKRHEMVHKNERPFKCPYCEYSCNNSENLRKHVIATSKHPGKFLYECHNCNDQHNRFKSNFLKDYQLHLLQVHPK